MISARGCEPIQIGLLTDVPMRIAGFASIFEQPAQPEHPQLLPIMGGIEEVLASDALKYLIVDMECSSGGHTSLAAIRRRCPDVRLIAIAPEGNDDLAMEAILSGARGCLNWNAGLDDVRMAVDVINRGLICAPARILSRLVDRLMKNPGSSTVDASPHLTDRELQVLELILEAQPNREIARQLGIEERTVRSHLGRLMRKTGVENRVELSMHALNHQDLLDKSAQGIRQHDAKS
jgi:DNA-binding NarL/FixJ family response regulator